MIVFSYIKIEKQQLWIKKIFFIFESSTRMIHSKIARKIEFSLLGKLNLRKVESLEILIYFDSQAINFVKFSL